MPRAAQEPARDAREAVRELNHATIFGGGYTWPSDVDAAVAALRELVAGPPQAFRQASRWLTTAHEAGDVGHDRGGHNTDAAVADARELLGEAEAAVWQLAELLDAAHQRAAHLTGVISDEDDEDADVDGGEPL